MLRNDLYKQHLRSNPTLLGDAADYAHAAESIHVLKFLKTQEKTDLYNNDRFPGFPLTLRVFQLLWRDKVDASCRASVFFGLMMIICTFSLALRLGNPAAAMLSSFLVAINLTLCLNSVEGYTEELYSVQILLFPCILLENTEKTFTNCHSYIDRQLYGTNTGEGFPDTCYYCWISALQKTKKHILHRRIPYSASYGCIDEFVFSMADRKYLFPKIGTLLLLA